jgi:hypothetical protein
MGKTVAIVPKKGTLEAEFFLFLFQSRNENEKNRYLQIHYDCSGRAAGVL